MLKVTPTMSAGGKPPVQLSSFTPALEKEMADVFTRSLDRDSWSRGELVDESRDSGARVSFYRGSGGCGEPTIHKWRIEKDGTDDQTALNNEVLRSPEHVSVNSDGTLVVGDFYRYPDEGQEQRVIDDLRARGVVPEDADLRPTHALVSVPVHGHWYQEPLRALQRRGWLVHPKVLTYLPESPNAIDIGPDNEVAVSAGNKVLKYTNKQGLRPWAELPGAVRDLEFLSDGSLAVMAGEGVERTFHHLDSGTVLSLKELYPQRHESEVNSRVSGVKFLANASLAAKESFLAQGSWLKAQWGWKRHEAVAARGDQAPVAVITREPDEPNQLYIFDPVSGRAGCLGALKHPDSNRFGSGRGELLWSDDGRYVVFTTKPEQEHGACDATVFSLETGEGALVPGVRDLSFEGDQLCFRLPTRVVKVPLARTPEIKAEPWYTEARSQDLFADDMLGKLTGLELDEESVTIGDTTLSRRTDT